MKAAEELKVSAVKGNFGLLRAGNELPQESQLQPTLLFSADFAALEPRLDGILKSLAEHPDGIGLCILDMDPVPRSTHVSTCPMFCPGFGFEICTHDPSDLNRISTVLEETNADSQLELVRSSSRLA